MRFITILTTILLVACGGGGGGGSSPAPAPAPTPAASVNLSADPLSVLVGNQTTLAWSTSYASSCSASGSWSGSKPTAGTEDVDIEATGDNQFTLTCSGSGGSGSASVTVEGYENTSAFVVDGYITGAQVFIDQNDNFVSDLDEPESQSSDSGSVLIKKVPGTFVSIGGRDFDTQNSLENLLLLHKNSDEIDNRAITPLTSVAAFLNDESLIHSIIGLDDTLDIYQTDPVANKGTEEKYNVLYEKGNQLTVLTYSIQELVNAQKGTLETSQDFFAALAEELDQEYVETNDQVNIESSAFIEKVLANALERKALELDEDTKTNLVMALASLMPVIQVKDNDTGTAAIFNFATSTLITDLKAIADGTIDAETLTAYQEDILKYVAEDQNIDLSEIAPEISAGDDLLLLDEDEANSINILNNDSFVVNSPIAISLGASQHGTESLNGGTVTYTPDKDYYGKDEIAYTLSQSGLTASAVIDITVNPVADAPEFTSGANFSVPENQTDVATLKATDADGDEVSYSQTGIDAASFNLEENSGILTFKEPPDYEAKDTFSIVATASDGTNATDKNLTIRVTNVNDIAPVFTSPEIISVPENQTSIGRVIATDEEGDIVVFAIENIVWNTESQGYSGPNIFITDDGLLSFESVPDYDVLRPAFNVDPKVTLDVVASDGDNTTKQNLTIVLTNVNDNEPNFDPMGGVFNFEADENQKIITNFVATDFDNDILTIEVSGSEIKFLEEISSEGTLAGRLEFVSAPDYETKKTYSANVTASDGINTTTQAITVNVKNLNDVAPAFTSSESFSVPENQKSIGTITATDAEGDSVTFTVSGDELNITEAGVLTFVTAPDYETKTSYSATVTASDGTNDTEQTITVSVNDVAEAVAVNDSSEGIEDDNIRVNVLSNDTFNSSDVSLTATNGTNLTVEVNDDATTIAEYGHPTIIYYPPANWFGEDSFTYTVTSGGESDTGTVNVTVTAVNDAPTVTSNSSFSADENQTAIGTVTAADIENNTIAFSVSGADSSTISINSSTGVLSFDSAPNYEVKDSYSIIVNASDGVDSTNQTVSISINDVNDAPVATAASYYLNLLPQDQTSGSLTLAGTDEDGDSLTYSIVSNGSYGTASLSGTTITYQTDASTQSAQTESFTFKVNDGTVDSSPATISIDLRSDPLYQYQWHLNNTGQTNFATDGGTSGVDLNVDSVISSGITGDGVKISIVDDGLEIAHEDLANNVISGSYDFANSDTDPTLPSPCEDESDCGGHGTSIGGIIAAEGWNNKGVRGIAPEASIFGANYLAGGGTEAAALGVNYPGGVTADIYNMSYGRGFTTTYSLQNYMSPTTEQKFINGVTNLRDGKGALYIHAAGNEYNINSNADCGTGKPLSCAESTLDHRSQSPYVISVGALDANGVKTSYSTPGSATWVMGFGGEYGYDSTLYDATGTLDDTAIMTIDRSSCSLGYSRTGDTSSYGKNRFNLSGFNFTEQTTLNPNCNYNSHFNGTSAAAPTVAGVIALMLEANSDLTWRDVKHILATTSVKVDASKSYALNGVTIYSWVENNAGHEFHNWYGFGKVDAAAAVAAAQSYSAGSLGSFVTSGYVGSGNISAAIPDAVGSTISLTVNAPAGSNDVVEYVRVNLQFSHAAQTTMGFRLQSPDGTIHNIVQPGTNIDDPSGVLFDVGVAGFYGETMGGSWTLIVDDHQAGTTGTLIQWGIEVYGN